MRQKRKKTAACWALKEKYWLWSFKIPLDAQSGLQFWHIVKKQMQQIRTYCSSGGVIRAFEPWAPLLCPCALGDKLTPSLSYSYYPSRCLLWKAICGDVASVVCHFVTSFTNDMMDVSCVCLLKERSACENGRCWFPQSWMAYKHSPLALAPAQLAFQ